MQIACLIPTAKFSSETCPYLMISIPLFCQWATQCRYGYSVGLVIERLGVRLPLGHCWRNNLREVNCSHPCASVTKQYKLVPV